MLVMYPQLAIKTNYWIAGLGKAGLLHDPNYLDLYRSQLPRRGVGRALDASRLRGQMTVPRRTCTRPRSTS